MRKGETYCLIDIGSHTCKGVVLRHTPQGLEVLAKGSVKSRGIEGGDVRDVAAVIEVIESLVSELEQESRVRRADFIVSSSHSNVRLIDHGTELSLSENEKKTVDESITDSLKKNCRRRIIKQLQALTLLSEEVHRGWNKVRAEPGWDEREQGSFRGSRHRDGEGLWFGFRFSV